MSFSLTAKLAMRVVGAGLAVLAPTMLAATTTYADQQPRLSGPIVHENVSVYLVHGTSAPGPIPQTLQEAMTKGTVVVHETGNVQQLEIENNGSEPVFVQFGDIVKGGQQDRVLTVSLLLEPKSGRVPIAAYCVEQGRWAARGKENVKQFALSESLMPSREAKIAMAKPVDRPAASAARPAGNANGQQPSRVPSQQRVEGGGEAGRGIGQGEVWRNVSKVQEQLGAVLSADVKSDKSKTSLQLALENEKLKGAQAAYLAVLDPAVMKEGDVIGVVIAVNGHLSGADIYPSNGLFRKMWPKIARAAATEALSHRAKTNVSDGKTADASPSATQPPPSVADVAAFLVEAENGKKSEREFGTLVKIETRDGDKALRVEARNANGVLVHKNYLAK